ncbi:YesL family protein [Salibacterium lacus]|uniref:YesL family protein n=1 Tax=Salibacterium lacus TaxID=1898109 RepID=A0ABW5T4H0_9BACI
MIERLGNGAFSICEWLARLAVINMFWILFTAAGLGLFGWAPATAAACTVMRSAFLNGGLADQDTRSVFREFKSVFQNEFVQANIVGFLLLWGSALLILSGWAMAAMEVPLLPRLLLIGTASLFALVFLLIFPVRTHLETSIRASIQYSLMIGLANLPSVFLVLLSVALMLMLFIMIPGVLVFYGVSLPVAAVMYMSLRIFSKTGLKTVSN